MTGVTKHLSERELGAVLVGLHLLQVELRYNTLDLELADVLDWDGDVVPMNPLEIGELCEYLNTED